MKIFRLKLFLVFVVSLCIVQQVFPQSSKNDSSYHPYKVNYWVTGSIIVVGGIANYLGVERSANRPEITDLEIKGLYKEAINSFDKWSFEFDPLRRNYNANLSDNLLTVLSVLPATLLFDKNIRNDWIDILLMLMETQSITNNFYENSFLGPSYQGRLRPIVYYESVPMDQRKDGSNRNSFYSGHTATATAATFFIAKVLSDYHPKIGAYKYLLYTAAAIPPLYLGYVRMKALKHFPSDILVGFGVGALCGIMIPELHRFEDKNLSFGVYSTSYSTGIAMKWQPDFLK